MENIENLRTNIKAENPKPIKLKDCMSSISLSKFEAHNKDIEEIKKYHNNITK